MRSNNRTRIRKFFFRPVVLSRIIPKGKVSRSGTTHERNYPSIRFGSRFTRGDPLVKESYRDGLVSLSPGIDFRLIVPTNPRDIKEYLGNFRFEITTLWITNTTRDTLVFYTDTRIFSWNERREGNIVLIKRNGSWREVAEIFLLCE